MDRSDNIGPSLLGQEDHESDLLLNGEGQWVHQGDVVEHRRLAAALHRWLTVDEKTGRYIIRAGEQWCFVTVEDAPYVVRGVVVENPPPQRRIVLRLSDETTEELTYDSLRQNEQHVLYCQVKGGRFPARFSRAAYFAIGELFELDGEEPVLAAAGRRWPVSADEAVK